MMKASRVAVIFVFFSFFCSLLIDHQQKGYSHRSLPLEARLLGPLGGLVASYHWIDIQNSQLNYQYEEVAMLTERVCKLQPYVVESWDYLAWNLAFNLFVEAGESSEEKWKWLSMGLDQLEEALEFNPDDDRLEMAMAITVYLKYTGTESMRPKLTSRYGRDPMRVCVDWVEKTSTFKSGELSAVKMALGMYRDAGLIDEGIEICHQQIKRFPSLREVFTEYIAYFESERR